MVCTLLNLDLLNSNFVDVEGPIFFLKFPNCSDVIICDENSRTPTVTLIFHHFAPFRRSFYALERVLAPNRAQQEHSSLQIGRDTDFVINLKLTVPHAMFDKQVGVIISTLHILEKNLLCF